MDVQKARGKRLLSPFPFSGNLMLQPGKQFWLAWMLAGVFSLFALLPAQAQIQWKVLGSEKQISATASAYTTITTVNPTDSLTVYNYGQTHWQMLGGTDGIYGGASAYTSVTVLQQGAEQIPYVAYTDSDGLAHVEKYDAGAWQAVGGAASSGHSSFTNIFSDQAGDLYLAYVDNDNGHRLAVKTWDTGTGAWEPLGGNAANLYVSTGSVVNGTSQLKDVSHNNWMAFDSKGTPYIVFAEMDGTGAPWVKRFTGGAWQTVGSGAVSADKASGVGIALDASDNPYIAYAAGTGSTGQLTVYGYTGGAWNSLDVPATLPNGRLTTGIRHESMVINEGKVYVMYMDTHNSNKATVIASSLSGTPAWDQVGGTLSGRDISYNGLAKDAAGNLYAAFIDIIANKSGRSVSRVMRLAKGESNWSEVVDTGGVTGIAEPTSYIFLAVDSYGSPYVAYTHPDDSGLYTPVVQYFPPVPSKVLDTGAIPYVAYTDDAGQAHVKKYQSGSWQSVGDPISGDHTSFTNIFSDQAGRLYLAYVDNDNDHKLAVVTWDAGTGAWEPLGGNAANLYVSTGSVVNGTSQLRDVSHNNWMAFDSKGTPYIVFAEMGSGGAPWVKRFTGGAWQTVGSGAISTDKASGVGIALDGSDNPYIAYAAGTGSTGQLTVYGYTGGSWTSLDVPATLPNGRLTTGIRHESMTINDNKVYVLYMDTHNSNKATVIASSLSGTPAWDQVGGTLSGRDISYNGLQKDSLGNLYAAFVDIITNKSGRSVSRVMKLPEGSTSWVEVVDTGGVTGIAEPSSYLSLAVAGNNSPYVAYIHLDADSVNTPVVQVYPIPVQRKIDTTVTVRDLGTTIILSNGIVSCTIDKSTATITELTYKGVNMLEGGYEGGKIYWSWNMPNYQNPSGCTYTLSVDPSKNKGEYAEVKFHMPWSGSASTAAMDVDIYYSLPRTAQGVYASAMLSHPASYPENPGGEWRMASYVGSAFDWLSVDSLRNRKMATLADWQGGTVPAGAPPEVELLHSGIYAGEYECKYDYSADFGDIDVWGWSSTSKDLGIWITAPSKEYYNGGPMKRELTGHNGPTLLNMLGGQHYGMGGDGDIAAGEDWSKVYGPFLIYVNSVADGTADAPAALWSDAKEQAKKEEAEWPYTWYANPAYVQDTGRGTVTGTLVIADTTDPKASAAGMWVGVAATPNSTKGITDFQMWSKNYQFWVKTDSDGNFTIPHVLPGLYNLYAFGPGAAGQMTKNNFVTVTKGGTASLGNVDWTPKRTAATVWAIGIPDRTAGEFRHGKDWWRSDSLPSTHWGKFMDYPDEFPDGVHYTVDSSDWTTDWNYVQPYDKSVEDSSPVWTVKFNLTKDPVSGSTAAVYVAYAASFNAANIVTVNGTIVSDPATGFIPANPSDAMVRKGIHGAFSDHWFTFPARLLHAGTNHITFKIRITGGASEGDIMYDYVRLEAGGTAATTKNLQHITFDTLASRHLNDADYRISATASSGLPVTFASSDSTVAIVTQGIVHITGEGSAEIIASQVGDSTYLPADDVSRTLVVTKARASQQISFPPLTDRYVGQPDFALQATSTSGLPVTYTSNNTAVAVVEGDMVHLVGVGPASITATQAGDDNWLAASDTVTFNVRTLNKASYNRVMSPNGDGINDKLVIDHISAYPDNRLQVFDRSGKPVYEKRGYSNEWDGRVRGKVLTTGTYYFIFTSRGKIIVKGSFTVIR
jgi:rhamnogalacturonan endolyase